MDCKCNFVQKELCERCPICLQPENMAMGAILFCGHSFHTECIKQWLSKVPSCPLCRQEISMCTSCTTGGSFASNPDYEFPVAETVIPTMFILPEFLALIKIQDLSDTLRRGFCDFGYLYGVDRPTYLAVMRLFSEYQTLDDDFVEDYYRELDIEMIYSRRDELLLSPDLILAMEKDLDIY